MGLFRAVLGQEARISMSTMSVWRLSASGRMLNDMLRKRIVQAEALTRANTGLRLIIAMNYGGRLGLDTGVPRDRRPGPCRRTRSGLDYPRAHRQVPVFVGSLAGSPTCLSVPAEKCVSATFSSGTLPIPSSTSRIPSARFRPYIVECSTGLPTREAPTSIRAALRAGRSDSDELNRCRRRESAPGSLPRVRKTAMACKAVHALARIGGGIICGAV